MARLKTEQARSMWTRLVLRYVLALLAFTVIYAVMLVTLGNGISRSLGNYTPIRHPNGITCRSTSSTT